MIGRRFAARALATAVIAVATVATLTGPASASNLPPAPDPRLTGTWVNTNATSSNVKQIVVRPNRDGSLLVDAFGACTPSLCEWGLVPAISYGPNVSAVKGAHFQTNQRFLSGDREFARTVLLGKLISNPRTGLQLKVRELTIFTDGSGRRNYTVNETFRLGEGQQPTKNGNPVSDYPLGDPPAPVAGVFGKWMNPAASPSLHSLEITAGAGGIPEVHGFGACSPTPCDWGTVRGITYGTSISSASGKTILAPFSFGFKNQQLVIVYQRLASGVEKLTVSSYNEFTDSSGRSNYTKTETLVRA